MKTILLLFLVVSCSRGSGVYNGVAVDVGWEGYIFPSCEVEFKTSEQASLGQKASSTSKDTCDRLMAGMGKRYVVKWKHSPFNLMIDTDYTIESVQEMSE